MNGAQPGGTSVLPSACRPTRRTLQTVYRMARALCPTRGTELAKIHAQACGQQYREATSRPRGVPPPTLRPDLAR